MTRKIKIADTQPSRLLYAPAPACSLYSPRTPAPSQICVQSLSSQVACINDLSFPSRTCPIRSTPGRQLLLIATLVATSHLSVVRVRFARVSWSSVRFHSSILHLMRTSTVRKNTTSPVPQKGGTLLGGYNYA